MKKEKDRLTIDVLGKIKEVAYDLVTGYAPRLKDCHYAEIRMEASESKLAVAVKGIPKDTKDDYEISFGVRVIAGDKMRAPGYVGQSLGAASLPRIETIFREGIHCAHQRAIANAEWKMHTKKLFGQLGQSIWSTVLAPVEIYQDEIMVPCQIDPRSVSLDEYVKRVVDVSRAIQKYDQRVKLGEAILIGWMIRELFCSSEGALIDHTYPRVEALIEVIAQDPGKTQEAHYDVLGNNAGWEVLEGENVHGKRLMDFAMDLAQDTVELCQAEECPTTTGPVPVVTDPHFNTLKVHEIGGHPFEGDRALKMEANYAGRTWFFRSLEDNQIGRQVASPLVTIYSDSSLNGYGRRKYDHEGVRGKRVVHIENGIFKGFLHSRQSAAVFQAMGLEAEPSGAMLAKDPVYVPLIRMTNTVFGTGDRDPQEIINEVDDGWYLKYHRVPSISESRENFRISARKVYRIKNGKLTGPYRNGGIEADTWDYLTSIDAVGNDFPVNGDMVYNVFNCGKGEPMQQWGLGNGGPTMRGKARLTGGKGWAE